MCNVSISGGEVLGRMPCGWFGAGKMVGVAESLGGLQSAWALRSS